MSSFVRNTFNDGIIGPTGPTGPIGPIGPRGDTGANIFGPTGSSITGITLTDSRLIFTWENGFTANSETIKGITGLWVVQFGVTAPDNQIIKSFSRNPKILSNSPTITTSDSLVLKTIHTKTPDVIEINRIEDNRIQISYVGSSGITLDQTNLNQLVIATSSNAFDGATNTNWNPTTGVLDWTIARYAEFTQRLAIIDTSYNINVNDGSVFLLIDEGTNNVQINLTGTIPSNQSAGITIIIPRTTPTVTFDIKSSVLASKIRFPLIAPLPKTGVNIYTGISIGNIWYFSCSMLGGISNTKTSYSDINPTFNQSEALQMLVGNCWNKSTTDNPICSTYDLNSDGFIDATDLTLLLSAWGANVFDFYSGCNSIKGPSFTRECISG